MRSDLVLRTTVEKMARDVGIKTLINHQIAIRDRQSSLPGLKDIKCPTMVVVGKQDIITPFDHANEIVDGIESARLNVLDDCGHMPGIEQPEILNTCFRDWFAFLDSENIF